MADKLIDGWTIAQLREQAIALGLGKETNDRGWWWADAARTRKVYLPTVLAERGMLAEGEPMPLGLPVPTGAVVVSNPLPDVELNGELDSGETQILPAGRAGTLPVSRPPSPTPSPQPLPLPPQTILPVNPQTGEPIPVILTAEERKPNKPTQLVPAIAPDNSPVLVETSPGKSELSSKQQRELRAAGYLFEGDPLPPGRGGPTGLPATGGPAVTPTLGLPSANQQPGVLTALSGSGAPGGAMAGGGWLTWLVLAGAGVAAWFLLQPKKGRRRRR